jgi:hypothetical protein
VRVEFVRVIDEAATIGFLRQNPDEQRVEVVAVDHIGLVCGFAQIVPEH